ncbi:hypothetical protein [Tenacibaculum maritimum]|uniref:hypothetical protein n=1 Tax=Tenacibaculum maritimum TaxID=107401 RepID=UPI0038764501
MFDSFLEKNWLTIVNMIGAVFMFFLGRKTRKVNNKTAEFLAYEKKLENYDLEFEIKTKMLENLKKDYDSRAIFLEDNLNIIKKNNDELTEIVKSQSEIIISQKNIIQKLQTEQKQKSLEIT